MIQNKIAYEGLCTTSIESMRLKSFDNDKKVKKLRAKGLSKG